MTPCPPTHRKCDVKKEIAETKKILIFFKAFLLGENCTFDRCWGGGGAKNPLVN